MPLEIRPLESVVGVIALETQGLVAALDEEELVSPFGVEDPTFEVNLPETGSCAFLLLIRHGNWVTSRKLYVGSITMKLKTAKLISIEHARSNWTIEYTCNIYAVLAIKDATL